MSQLPHRYWLRLWVCIRAMEHTITADDRRHCRHLPLPWILTDVGDPKPLTSTRCSKWVMVSKILWRRVPWTMTLEIIHFASACVRISQVSDDNPAAKSEISTIPAGICQCFRYLIVMVHKLMMWFPIMSMHVRHSVNMYQSRRTYHYRGHLSTL